MNTDTILKLADRCVKCGLCLPKCPTYSLLSDESDSPRGRITLIQAYIKGDIGSSPSFIKHLNRCLGCRQCELACPSEVSFGQILDETKNHIRNTEHGQRGTLPGWILDRLSERSSIARISRLLQVLGVKRWMPGIANLGSESWPLLANTATQLNSNPLTPGTYPTSNDKKGDVQLFIGCVANLTDPATQFTAVKLLNLFGFDVNVPDLQTCCGALHQHNGMPTKAAKLNKQNNLAFGDDPAKPVITLASACHLELTESKALSVPVFSLTGFILMNDLLSKVELAPLDGDIFVHSPCTTRQDQAYNLLLNIPDSRLHRPPENDSHCCGAAGSYLLTEPDLSARLGMSYASDIARIDPMIVATSNTGCAIQFRRIFKQNKMDIAVMHPIEIIWRQLELALSKTPESVTQEMTWLDRERA